MKLILNLHGFVMEHEIPKINLAPQKLFVLVKKGSNVSEVLSKRPKVNTTAMMFEFKLSGYKKMPKIIGTKMSEEKIGHYEIVTMVKIDGES